jgi:hypothetical protein
MNLTTLKIGINYVGQEKELRGCYNDAKNMANFLISNSIPALKSVSNDHHSQLDIISRKTRYFSLPMQMPSIVSPHVKNCLVHLCGWSKVQSQMIRSFSIVCPNTPISILLTYLECVDSGHGGQSPDASGREADGMDDSMCRL